MKKWQKMVAIVSTVAAMASAAKADMYAQLCKIEKIEDDVVTIVNCNGMMYEFDGAEDWEVGDFMSVVMDDNGTEDVEDDTIVSATYERPDLFE